MKDLRDLQDLQDETFTEELITKATEALHSVNEKRKLSLVEAGTFVKPDDLNEREEKMLELKKLRLDYSLKMLELEEQNKLGYLFLKIAYVP